MRIIDEGRTIAKKDEAADMSTGASDRQAVPEAGEREMLCPVCGTPMPDLKGGKATSVSDLWFQR